MSTLSRIAMGTIVSGACFGYGLVGSVFASNLKEVTLANSNASQVSLRNRLKPQSYQRQPVQIFVSLNNQSMSVFRGLDLIRRSKISSGKKGHNTPRGFFSILEKKKYHESNLYNNAPMPYMQRLTWSGIALHQGHVPNYPASHGCIRMPKKVAASIFKKTNYRDHVIVSFEDATPKRVKHPTLFQPKFDLESNFSLRDSNKSIDYKFISGSVEKKNAPLRIYATRENLRTLTKHAQNMMQALGYYYGTIDGKLGPNTIKRLKHFQAQNRLATSGQPDSATLEILKKKSGRTHLTNARIYVRQNHKPLFDFPIKIKNPKKPLGSHLLMTHNFNKLETEWISTTISTRIPKSMRITHNLDETSKKRVFGSVKDALNRIIISDEVKEKIGKLLTTGSSFAISDNGISTDTGKGTDFIVRTH